MKQMNEQWMNEGMNKGWWIHNEGMNEWNVERVNDWMNEWTNEWIMSEWTMQLLYYSSSI